MMPVNYLNSKENPGLKNSTLQFWEIVSHLNYLELEQRLFWSFYILILYLENSLNSQKETTPSQLISIIQKSKNNSNYLPNFVHDYFIKNIHLLKDNILKLILAKLSKIDVEMVKNRYSGFFSLAIEPYQFNLRNDNFISKRNDDIRVLNSVLTHIFYDQEGIKEYLPNAINADFKINNLNEVTLQHPSESKCIALALQIYGQDRYSKTEILNSSAIKNWNPNSKLYDLIISDNFLDTRFADPMKTEEGNVKDWYQFVFFNLNKSLVKNGKAFIYVPQKFLVSMDIIDLNVRKYLIETGFVRAIINIPYNKYSNFQSSLFVFDNSKGNKTQIKFINPARINDNIFNEFLKIFDSNDEEKFNEFYQGSNECKIKFVPIQDIISNDFKLNPIFYIRNNFDGIKVRNILEPIKLDRAITSDDSYIISISNLKRDVFNYKTFVNELSYANLGENLFKVDKSCFIISKIGSDFKLTWLEISNDIVFLKNNNVVALELIDENIDRDYLVFQLFSEQVKEQLEIIVQGFTIKTFKIDDFLDIKIPLLSFDEQKNLVESNLKNHQEIIDSKYGFDQRISTLKNRFRDELKLKEHIINNALSGAISQTRAIERIMEKNNGILSSTSQIPTHNNQFLYGHEALKNVRDILMEVARIVDKLTDEINFRPGESIDPIELINEAIRKGVIEDDLFEIQLNDNKENFTINLDGQNEIFVPDIFISKENFFDVYNNILGNAIKHGFLEKGKKYRFIIDMDCSNSLSEVIFRFRNNGLPLSKGFTSESYRRMGEKAGKTGNTGIGGSQIFDIIEHFNGRVEMFNEPDEEFPIRIDIILPAVNI